MNTTTIYHDINQLPEAEIHAIIRDLSYRHPEQYIELVTSEGAYYHFYETCTDEGQIVWTARCFVNAYAWLSDTYTDEVFETRTEFAEFLRSIPL